MLVAYDCSMENMPSEENRPMQQPAGPVMRVPNPYVLPASIIAAALIVAGSIVYLVQSGGSGGSGTPGVKTFPETAFSRCIDNGASSAKVQAQYEAATAAGVNSTPTTFVNGKKVTDADGNSVGANGQYIVDAIEAALKNKTVAPATGGLALGADEAALGAANAPVTLIEYGDYQCPFCARYFEQVEPVLRAQYIDTGKVKMVFRNFAFLGPESVASAEAAACAAAQGKFWEYHEALYAAEAKDGQERNGNLDRQEFLQLAEDLKLTAK